ncbi:MBL fold metallo-hydrolase [Zhouia sp. PK063]|uniref:MBL fold metallo-hydrolase n=1 Tax=Zhouia sp. PK063 TaxID=3373602 RepID=UPI0037B4B16D
MEKTKLDDVPSSIYNNGTFENLECTPQLADDASYIKLIQKQFSKPAAVKPSAPIPHVITDLKSLYSETPVMVWFGHSSYLLSCKGFNLLLDPVFSGSASPFSFMIKAYEGADVYKAEHMPHIDLHLQSHNHYDHLDKKTVKALAQQTKAYVVPRNVDSDLTSWGVAADKITTLDWGEQLKISEDIQITATPARHFAGRGLKRNTSLWSSYVLDFYGMRIFVGGDSGYGTHFKEIGNHFGPFDVAILECGQYGVDWPYIHTLPEETLQVALDIKAKKIIPVHWAKFTLALHPWNEPVERLLTAAKATDIPVITPRIGEVLDLKEGQPGISWWQGF